MNIIQKESFVLYCKEDDTYLGISNMWTKCIEDARKFVYIELAEYNKNEYENVEIKKLKVTYILE
ncbi:UNVERIFIED_ORG: hypothetical protein B2H93_04680 [Clostridium botulinum]